MGKVGGSTHLLSILVGSFLGVRQVPIDQARLVPRLTRLPDLPLAGTCDDDISPSRQRLERTRVETTHVGIDAERARINHNQVVRREPEWNLEDRDERPARNHGAEH